MVHDYREFRQPATCPNTYIWGHCVVCGNAGDEGCPLEPDRPDCQTCQDTREVSTDDPLALHGKAQCPDCCDDDTLRYNQRA